MSDRTAAWLILVVWTTQVLAVSKVAKPLRSWLERGAAIAPGRSAARRRVFGVLHDLIRCPMCAGFWVGLGLRAAGLPYAAGGWPAPASYALCAVASSLAAYVAHVLLVRLGSLAL